MTINHISSCVFCSGFLSPASVLGFSFWYPILLSRFTLFILGLHLLFGKPISLVKQCLCFMAVLLIEHTFMPTSVSNPFFTDIVHNAKMADSEGCGGGGGTYNYLKSQQIRSEVK